MAFVEDGELLRSIARRIVGDADADDVVQETLLRALVSAPSGPDPTPRAWLAAVARHVAIDWWRRRRPLAPLPEEAAVEVPPDEERPSLPELLTGLSAHSEGEVLVLLLRDALDLDVDEVAAALDTSVGTVRVLHHRARARLRAAGPGLGSGPGLLPGPGDLRALQRFLTWLLARQVAGLPLRRPRAGADPGYAPGVLEAHARLLDAVVVAARRAARDDLVGPALLARGTARRHTDPGAALEDLRQALAQGAPAAAVRLRMLGPLMDAGRWREAEEVARAALADTDAARTPWLHQFLARLAVDRGDREAAHRHVEAARALTPPSGARSAGDVAAAFVALGEERYADARGSFLAGLAAVRERANAHDEPALLNNVAQASLELGALDEARPFATEALALARARGDRSRTAAALGTLGTLALRERRWDDAAEAYARSLDIARAIGAATFEHASRQLLAAVDLLRGRAAAAAVGLDALPPTGRGPRDRPTRLFRAAAGLVLGEAVSDELAALREEAAGAAHRSVVAAVDRLAGPDPAAGDPDVARAVIPWIATEVRRSLG